MLLLKEFEMKKIKEINITEDTALLKKLSIASIPLFVVFYILFFVIAINIRPGIFINENSILLSFITAILIFIAIIIIHEAIHGVFFKLFAPHRKVNFGIIWRKGMAYATSPGSKFKRWQMVIIAVMPFIINSALLTVAYTFTSQSVSQYVLLATAHAVACVGDFYYIWVILRAPRGALVEDTETGLTIWRKF